MSSSWALWEWRRWGIRKCIRRQYNHKSNRDLFPPAPALELFINKGQNSTRHYLPWDLQTKWRPLLSAEFVNENKEKIQEVLVLKRRYNLWGQETTLVERSNRLKYFIREADKKRRVLRFSIENSQHFLFVSGKLFLRFTVNIYVFYQSGWSSLYH